MSGRQELRGFAESGKLRQALNGKLTDAAVDLAVEVVRRYCEPRRPPLWKRTRQRAAGEGRG